MARADTPVRSRRHSNPIPYVLNCSDRYEDDLSVAANSLIGENPLGHIESCSMCTADFRQLLDSCEGKDVPINEAIHRMLDTRRTLIDLDESIGITSFNVAELHAACRTVLLQWIESLTILEIPPNTQKKINKYLTYVKPRAVEMETRFIHTIDLPSPARSPRRQIHTICTNTERLRPVELGQRAYRDDTLSNLYYIPKGL